MLMGSINSSHHQQQEEQQQEQQQEREEEEEEEEGHLIRSRTSDVQQQSISSQTSAMQIRQLLITCGNLISNSDQSSAQRLVSAISAKSSPCGDSNERLAHHFCTALFLFLNSSSTPPPTTTPYDLQSSYLTLNQITPFIRFTHLTANQAILESIDDSHRSLHILDFDIMHGLQWPPFMQALAERSAFHHFTLRITAVGTDLDLLHRTGDRLLRFALSLGLRFQFLPLFLPDFLPSALPLQPDEPLAVNCVFHLHTLLRDGGDNTELRAFLRQIKGLNPRVVTVAEREADLSHPSLVGRLAEGLEYYAAVFESLEATLPPNSRERMTVEQVWFGREIAESVVGGDRFKRRRCQRFEWWERLLRECGFHNVPLSPFALSQAKLLLRLHYPSQGYQLRTLNAHSFFLGWLSRPLFSVSSWH